MNGRCVTTMKHVLQVNASMKPDVTANRSGPHTTAPKKDRAAALSYICNSDRNSR
jgi:hypothetical protein